MKKMNVLLVMPKVPYAINDWNIPPVGILYVSSYMKKIGISVHCLNLCISDEEPCVAVERAIRENGIDIVATGDLVVNYEAVREIVDCAKNVSSSIITLIGGGLVTHSPEEAMQLIPNADYGVIGEGEITDSELVLALENGTDPAKVDGIIYRDDGKLVRSAPRAPIEDLDAIPWPDYEGFDYFEIARRYSQDGTLTAPLTTSRSCPFQCTFCSTSGGGKYRQRSLDAIFQELQYLVERFQVKEVFLNDELFAVNADRVREFCLRIAPTQVKWHVMLRIGKHIQPELLQLMRDSGCVGVCYGLESADDSILRSMKKTGVTQMEMLRVLEITKAAGLKVRGGFIFGDALETMETARYTMNWIEEHIELLENISISPIVLYPGSQLYENAVRSGKIPDTVQFIRYHCPLVNPSERMDDETYWELVNSQIPSFAARYRRKIVMRYREELREHVTPLKGKGRYRHEFCCRSCGKPVSEEIFPSGMFQHHTSCPHCGARYDLFPGIAMLQEHEDEISRCLQEKDCVIWGAGESAQDLYWNNAWFRSADGLLVDHNGYKQAHGFNGKPVLSPETLTGNTVDTILCCIGLVNYNSVQREITERAFHPRRVIWIYDLLLAEEECGLEKE